MRRPARSLSLALGLSVAGAGLFVPARAEQARTTWTTYLYQGPGTRYSVVGEVPQATPFDLGPCEGGWCRVTYGERTGYVLAEVVAKGDPAVPAPGVLPQPAASIVARPAGPCFEVDQKGGNGGNARTVVCGK